MNNSFNNCQCGSESNSLNHKIFSCKRSQHQIDRELIKIACYFPGFDFWSSSTKMKVTILLLALSNDRSGRVPFKQLPVIFNSLIVWTVGINNSRITQDSRNKCRQDDDQPTEFININSHHSQVHFIYLLFSTRNFADGPSGEFANLKNINSCQNSQIMFLMVETFYKLI